VEGIGSWLDPSLHLVEVTSIKIGKADKPDFLFDLANTHPLAGEDDAERFALGARAPLRPTDAKILMMLSGISSLRTAHGRALDS
jgi:hypothetical protein